MKKPALSNRLLARNRKSRQGLPGVGEPGGFVIGRVSGNAGPVLGGVGVPGIVPGGTVAPGVVVEPGVVGLGLSAREPEPGLVVVPLPTPGDVVPLALGEVVPLAPGDVVPLDVPLPLEPELEPDPPLP